MSHARIVAIRIGVNGPRGVNAYLVIGDRPIIVDTGIPGSAPRILGELAAQGFEPRDVAAIVITHEHIDHAGSAAEIERATGAPVVAQARAVDNLRRGVSAAVVGRTPEIQQYVDRMGIGQEPEFEPVDVDIVVEEEYALDDLGVPARLIHTPGHTPGSMTLVTSDREVIVGDTIANADPAGEHAGPGPFTLDLEAMLESNRRIAALKPTKVYCGHDGPFGPEALMGLT